MSDLLISFDNVDTNKNEDNQENNKSTGLVDKSNELLINEIKNSSDLNLIDVPISNNNQIDNKEDSKLDNFDELTNESNNETIEVELNEEIKEGDDESIELNENEKKKVLQELNQRVIDEQKLNSELISKLHIQLDNAITEKEELLKQLNEKESDLSEVEVRLKEQAERLKQLEDVESTNSKLKALAVKLKKELAEVKINVSIK
jgi:hypothetical protein